MRTTFIVHFISAQSLIQFDDEFKPFLPFVPKDMSFPKDFMFGFGSAAFQVEGAVAEDGKSPSIWDKFASNPSRVNNDDPKISNDEYHLFAETVKLLKFTNANTYRMSISWSRIVPQGFARSPVNQKAIDHYNLCFDMLIENGITPMVTLYHWDLPQALQDKYSGLMDKDKFTRDFLYYADTAFKSFKQIEYWITFYEPLTHCVIGYSTSIHAPGKKTKGVKEIFGLEYLDMFKCAHHVLVAHGHVVNLYRNQYGRGKISMANVAEWSEPMTSSNDDIIAANLKIEFTYGWFMDPLYTGIYPKSILKKFSLILPKFTSKEIQLINGSTDFVALNHFTTTYTGSRSRKTKIPQANGGVPIVPWKAYFYNINRMPIGGDAQSDWMKSVPWGFQKILEYIDSKYGAPDIIVTANGFSVVEEQEQTRDLIINDLSRVYFYREYIKAMSRAAKNGVKLKGYIVMSLMDSFEWAQGYTERFGCVYIDRDTQYRYLKSSAYFLRKVFGKSLEN